MAIMTSKYLHRGEKPVQPLQNHVMASSHFCKLEGARHKMAAAQMEQESAQYPPSSPEKGKVNC